MASKSLLSQPPLLFVSFTVNFYHHLSNPIVSLAFMIVVVVVDAILAIIGNVDVAVVVAICCD